MASTRVRVALLVTDWRAGRPLQRPRAAPYLLPQLAGHMCALDGLQVKVQAAVLLPDSGIAAVGQRARGAVAQAGDVVLVAAEVLRLRLHLEGAMVVVDDLHAPARVALSVSAQSQGAPPLNANDTTSCSAACTQTLLHTQRWLHNGALCLQESCWTERPHSGAGVVAQTVKY